MTMQIDTLDAIRATYGVLSKAFAYPDEELWSRLEGLALKELIGDLESDDVEDLDGAYVFPTRSQDERTAIYLDLFELGKTPLYEGSFRPSDGRAGIQEELLRFYNFFDLKLGEKGRDYPDYVVTELEFMMYLVGLEAAALKDGRDPAPLRLAQKDFLDRHVLVWANEMKKRQFGADKGVYSTLASWLGAFTQSHRDVVGDALAESAVADDERVVCDTRLACGG
jgi:DMSO reductase family type II enzyme chaperone